MALVFTSNDLNTSELRNQWKDVTGVRYHFPNMYRNMITPGETFIYYRGVHREVGPRGPATYFGMGMVGSVWQDPETEGKPPAKRSWYCGIDEYVPFPSPVSAKQDGTFIEDIPRNMWRSGVRRLSDDALHRIIQLAGIAEDRQEEVSVRPVAQVPLQDVVIPVGTSLILAPANVQDRLGSSTSTGQRRTRHAKLIGDRAEEIALKWLQQNVPQGHSFRWVARDGATPGWDIQYENATGELVGVEVKGTSGAAFTSFELTANELAAVRLLRNNFHVLLVADCPGKCPQVQMISDMDAGLSSGLYQAEPTGWKISLPGRCNEAASELSQSRHAGTHTTSAVSS